ncbi:MAG: hypothetical protein SFW62_02180 [Alphaproteobacteria bacterium]|nr:hypothetical protein [Alphaproteobacteria bacterium]
MTKFIHSSSLDDRQLIDVYCSLDPQIFLPFQRDYKDLLSTAMEWAIRRGVELEAPLANHSSASGCTMRLSGLNIYILRAALDMPTHDVGDIAVLENSETGAHVVLYGEFIKGWLDRGMGGFLLAPRYPHRTITALMRKWSACMAEMKAQCPSQQDKDDFDRHACVEKLAACMQPLDWDVFEQKYVVPALGPRELIKRCSREPVRSIMGTGVNLGPPRPGA